MHIPKIMSVRFRFPSVVNDHTDIRFQGDSIAVKEYFIIKNIYRNVQKC